MHFYSNTKDQAIHNSPGLTPSDFDITSP